MLDKPNYTIVVSPIDAFPADRPRRQETFDPKLLFVIQFSGSVLTAHR